MDGIKSVSRPLAETHIAPARRILCRTRRLKLRRDILCGTKSKRSMSGANASPREA
jgi:hypothetical protein